MDVSRTIKSYGHNLNEPLQVAKNVARKIREKWLNNSSVKQNSHQ